VGPSGVDRITITEIDDAGVDVFLDGLQQELVCDQTSHRQFADGYGPGGGA